MIPFDRFMAYQCTRCGHWQGRFNQAWSPDMHPHDKIKAIKGMTLHCRYCKNNMKFKKENDEGSRINHRWGSTAEEVKQTVMFMNSQRGKPAPRESLP